MASCGLIRTTKIFANKNLLGSFYVRNISDFGLNVKPLQIGFLGAPFDRGQVRIGYKN